MCERGLLCHHDMILKGSCDGRQGGEQQDELAGSSPGDRGASVGGRNQVTALRPLSKNILFRACPTRWRNLSILNPRTD